MILFPLKVLFIKNLRMNYIVVKEVTIEGCFYLKNCQGTMKNNVYLCISVSVHTVTTILQLLPPCRTYSSFSFLIIALVLEIFYSDMLILCQVL